MRLVCKEAILPRAFLTDKPGVKGLQDIAMALHACAGSGEDALGVVSTKMQVWSRVYSNDPTRSSGSTSSLDLPAIDEGPDDADLQRAIAASMAEMTEPEPEPEPEPELEPELEPDTGVASLLVGHIVGVMTPPRCRLRGHATLALRECIAHLVSIQTPLTST